MTIRHRIKEYWASFVGFIRRLQWHRIREYWTATGVIPRWQLFAVYALVIGVGIVGFWRVGDAASRADESASKVKRLSEDNARLGKENRKLSLAIQAQRVATIFDSCTDQNNRHDDAVKITIRLLGHPAVPPTQKLTSAQEAAQKKAILEWIGALVPHRDCQQVVEQATSP